MADESSSFDKVQFGNLSAASVPNVGDRRNETIRLGDEEFERKFQKFYKSQVKLKEEMEISELHKIKEAIWEFQKRKLPLKPQKSLASWLIGWGSIFNLKSCICLTSEVQPRYYIVIDVTRPGSFDKFNAFCNNVINSQEDPDQAEKYFQTIKEIDKSVWTVRGVSTDRETVVNNFRNQVLINTYFMIRQNQPYFKI